MSQQDPIADMFTRIRNAHGARKQKVTMPSSTRKVALAELLREEGYIGAYEVVDVEGKLTLTIELKYFEGKPVIETLKRVSRPGLRVYLAKDDIPKVKGGLGIAIVSTSNGLMTDRTARVKGIGGELVGLVA